ncbi:hypothetical protein P167DRAFT_236623 [Morchella conica CCBAS932]|uniref:Uncharacterized protein n=2 Tax=Morchella sect. Distantes TaxID=1051054 RepID=A0A3N4KJZ7_9PEZI|nr:hypothetical protein P167DRAFT_236623 [Morchella conica CCBAS932]
MSTRSRAPAESLHEQYSFPNLTGIGRGFEEAIEHINNESHQNLQADARSWLIATAHQIMKELKYELRKLQINRDTPSLLPRYAYDPTASLLLSSDDVPPHLYAFSGQFIDYITQLLMACGFHAKIYLVDPGSLGNWAISSPAYIRIEITFPHVYNRSEAGDGRIVAFDVDENFNRDFFGSMSTLST